MEYSLKDTWKKLTESCDPLSDMELSSLIRDLSELEPKLEDLGLTFRLAANEIIRARVQCEGWAIARGFVYHGHSNFWYPLGPKQKDAAIGPQ
jgi:hypothetical protein